jgi:putative transposase
MLNRFREIAEARCTGWGGKLIELNGGADHVHLLLRTASEPRLLRKEFADKLNRVYRKPVLWSRSYCILSCGGAPLSILKQYIERQAQR